VLGVLLIVMVPSQSGAFFGVVDAKPYWHSALLPILLFVSAMTAGAATLCCSCVVVVDRREGPQADGDRWPCSGCCVAVVLAAWPSTSCSSSPSSPSRCGAHSPTRRRSRSS
jgi:Ni/Fe-hydrogenase subunit HybB-like protein